MSKIYRFEIPFLTVYLVKKIFGLSEGGGGIAACPPKYATGRVQDEVCFSPGKSYAWQSLDSPENIAVNLFFRSVFWFMISSFLESFENASGNVKTVLLKNIYVY